MKHENSFYQLHVESLLEALYEKQNREIAKLHAKHVRQFERFEKKYGIKY